MPPRAKAILLDLDGVLWTSIQAHRTAFQKTLRDFGYPQVFSKKVFRGLAGMTTERAFEMYLKDQKIPVTPQRIATFSKRKRFWAIRYLKTRAALHPRLLPALRRLHRQYRLGLVSSGHSDSVALFLKRSKTRRLFDVILSSREVPDSKPSPRIYRTALRKLKIKASDARAVEDTVSGTRSAAACGITVIGMRGTCPEAQLRKAGAVKMISRLSELN